MSKEKEMSLADKEPVTKVQQRQFHEMIMKRELRKAELEKETSDLKQRLDVLENSVSAVMVWNIWRKSRGPVSSLKGMLKEFVGSDAGGSYCPRTASRHYDCRVREAEADRKQEERRVLEATSVLTEKQVLLESKRRRLDEAKKVQQERQGRIDQLTREVRDLKEATQDKEVQDENCLAGECKDIECKRRLLSKTSGSFDFGDLECLEELQQLAQSELTMKKEIEEFEEREMIYMKTLQQADELWSKVEGASGQLDAKEANRKLADRIKELESELEMQRTKSVIYKSELEKLGSVGTIETAIGRDSDLAEVRDKSITARVKLKNRTAGSD